MPDRLNYDVLLIKRSEWGARKPRSVSKLTSNLVTSHWEGPEMGTFPHSSCAAKVRGIQAFHMDSRGWSDIAYNALPCPHGYVFEGRGRGVRSAANGTTAGNSGAYAVCYLGGQNDPFTDLGQNAMKAAGDWLTNIRSGRNCHRDWKSTQCPGDTICTWTKVGQPITWRPDEPDPPIKPTEDEVALTHLRTTGMPPRVIWDGRAIGFKSLADFNNLVSGVKAAGIPIVVWNLTKEQNNLVVEQFNGDVVALRAIEKDLADEEPSDA